MDFTVHGCCSNTQADAAAAVLPKNFHGSSDNCLMGFIYSIEIYEICHRTFGSSQWKCPTCPTIFVNTAAVPLMRYAPLTVARFSKLDIRALPVSNLSAAPVVHGCLPVRGGL